MVMVTQIFEKIPLLLDLVLLVQVAVVILIPQFLIQSQSFLEFTALANSSHEFMRLRIILDRDDLVQTDFAVHDAGGQEAKLIRQKAAASFSSLVPVDRYETTVLSTRSFNESCL